LSSEIELKACSWDQIYNLTLKLADKIQKSGFRPDLIVGVSRGGWTPARIMSDLLENPELASVRTEIYSGIATKKGNPAITQPVSTSVRGKKVLIVDDIADTGESLRLVRLHLKKLGAITVKIASLHYKPWSIVTPDWYEKETSSWIIFPWEIKETVRNLVNRCKGKGKSIEEAAERLVQSGINHRLVEQFIQEIVEAKP
jgi:hypoxanthine phosphoribosyltransferase